MENNDVHLRVVSNPVSSTVKGLTNINYKLEESKHIRSKSRLTRELSLIPEEESKKLIFYL